MKKEVFDLNKGLNVQELEERHEMSIIAPEFAAQERCNDRCGGNTVEADIPLSTIIE